MAGCQRVVKERSGSVTTKQSESTGGEGHQAFPTSTTHNWVVIVQRERPSWVSAVARC